MNLPRLLAIVPVQCCRFCGCTPEHSCKVPGGDECMYPTPRADRCSHPACIAAFEAEHRRAIEADRRYRQIVRELRSKSSKGSKKKRHNQQRRSA